MSINMKENAEDEKIQQWLYQPNDARVLSTDWYSVEDFTGTIYNVLGSSDGAR